MKVQENFSLREDGFDPRKLNHHETLFTIGNGYLSTRGTYEEGFPGERKATLLHGVFDDVPVVFTELANVPDWTALEVRVDGEAFSLASGEIIASGRSLDLYTGLLSRKVRWRSPAGRSVDLLFERFASLADPHVLCQRVSIRAVDFSGEIEVRAGLNGAEDTLGALHWRKLDQHAAGDLAWLHLETRATGIRLGMAMRLIPIGEPLVRQDAWDANRQPTLVVAGNVRQGESLVLEKQVVLYTSRDLDDPLDAALERSCALADARWEDLFESHCKAWEREWSACDVVIEGDEDAQLAVRFNIYQLLIAAPRQDERVSIGAKTLSGYGYRGHAFWDTEIFMLPFFTYTRPEVARNLLSYRWRNLPGARQKAQANGFAGAQYPWESAGTGEEVTPTWVPDPDDRTALIRIWTGDIEIHVSSDIAYAILQYWSATGDDEFLVQRGAQVVLETARFWASRAEWDPEMGRYGFSDVIGPDEYHDHVDNNAYTNYFARWHLLKSIELFRWLQSHTPRQAEALARSIELEEGEVENWGQVAAQIYCPFDPQSGLIEQFDGYFQREDVSLEELEPRSQSVQALFGIEGVNRTQVIKQPDVLMLFYLLPDAFDERTVRLNYDYYTPRTDHTFGSSLGPAIQAIMACRVGEIEAAYEHFQRAAHADLYDVRGNAGDGIHGASAGGLWQAVVFGFAGLRFSPDGWSIRPQLPAGWKRLSFKFFNRGKLEFVEIH